MKSVFQIQADRLCRVRAGNDPVEDLFPLGDDGFLDEDVVSGPSDGQLVPGALLPPETVAVSGVTVLLGEPGGGKTTVLRRIVQELRAVGPEDPETSDGYVWVNGSDLTENSYQDLVGRYLAALPRRNRRVGGDSAAEPSSTSPSRRAGGRLTVVLDQLDESTMLAQLPGLLERSLHSRDTADFRMLLACRTADYRVRLTEVLQEHFSECSFADLAPLSRAEAVRLADSAGVDGMALIVAAVAVGAGSLASAPLTLELLVRTYRENGGLSGDPRELFASGTRLLAGEHDPGRFPERTPRTSPSQRLEIAGRIAARMLLCGRRTLWDGHGPRSRPHRLDLKTDELIGGVEESAPGDCFPVTPEAVREALGTALFTAIDHERSSFRHSSLSAYLAASYLARRRLPHRRLAELFLVDVPGTNASRIPPPLREAAAWLVALDPEHTEWLVTADPESVTVHSALVRSDAMRELIVSRLLDNAADVELSSTRWQFSRWDLVHPRLADQIRAALTGDLSGLEDDWPLRARVRVAVRLAQDCATPELAGPLLAICGDDRCPATERRFAVAAVFACAPEAAAGALRSLLTSLQDDDYAARVDPDDELRGTLLSGLWPRYIGTAAALDVLRPPRNPDLIGAYHYFLRTMVADCADDQVVEILRWLTARGVGFLGSMNSVVEGFIDEVIDRILRMDHAAGLRSLVASIFVGRLRRHEDIFFPAAFDSIDVRGTEPTDAERLALVEALVRESLRLDRFPAHELWVLTRSLKRALKGIQAWRTAGELPSSAPVRTRLLTEEDFGWVLDQGDRAVEAGEPDVAEAYGFIALHLFRHDDQAAFELLYSRQENPAWRRLKWFFEGIPLDSELAQSMRMSAKATKRNNGSVAVEFSVAQHKALAEARSGDTESFLRLLWNLQLDPETGKGSRQYGYDLAEWPGAGVFSAEHLAVLTDCALHYLGAEHDHRDDWLGTGRQGVRAWAGYRSLVLLHQADRIDEVPEQLWSRWTAAVVCGFPADSDERSRRIQTDLLRRAACHAPADFALDLERAVRGELARGQHFWNLRFLDPQWAAPLASAMERLACLVAVAVGHRKGAGSGGRTCPTEPAHQAEGGHAPLVLPAEAADPSAVLDTWSWLLEALLSAGSGPARRLGTEVLTSSADSSEPDRRELAVRVARAMLIADAPEAWPRIRALVSTSEGFSRALAETCAMGEVRQRIESSLTEAELAELYRWLHSLSADVETAYRLGGHFVGPAQHVVQWRDAVPRVLINRCTPEALHALKALTTEFSWRLGLRAALVAGRNSYAAAGWEGMQIDEAIRTLSLPEPPATYVLGDHIELSGNFIGEVAGKVVYDSETRPADAEFARLDDLNRRAVDTARSLRRVLGANGPETPWLHTPLSDVLEELNDPAPTAARVRSAADVLKPWIGWQPSVDGFQRSTAERVEAVLAVWSSREDDRAECLLAIEKLATTLDRAGPEAARSDGLDIVAGLGRMAAVAEVMGDLIRELCAAFEAAGPVDDLPADHLLAQRQLFTAVQDLEVCRRRLAGLGFDAALFARATGALLIAGGWGTGKSYGLGAWAEARVGAGAPVAFVTGRELVGDEPWEGRLSGVAAPGSRGGPARKLLAALQKHADSTGKNAVLIIDALNDVTRLRGDELDGFESLAMLLKEFPSVLLVASTRLDRRLTPAETRHRSYGIHWASGVTDPGQAWEVMRDVYKVPALVLPPDVAELRRPLMLAVLAWCLHRERGTADPETPVSVPSIGDLFEWWLRILGKDYFEYLHGRPTTTEHPLVSRACALLGVRIGLVDSLDYHAACDALRPETELGDPARLLEWLFQAGVLAFDPQNQRIGFAVQRFAEHIWAGNLMRDPGRRRHLTSLLRDLAGPEEAAGRAFRLLSALAGVVPHVHSGKELSHFLPRRLPPLAVMAILESLEGRHRDLIADASSLDFLRRWTTDPELAPWVWYTVLVNSANRGHPAGADFLHEELGKLGRNQLASRFVVPILHLLEDRDGLNMLQRFIRWASSCTEEVRKDARAVTRVLLWLSAVPSQPLRSLCVRIVAQIWRDDPETAIEQLELFGNSADGFIAEATWLAAYGALLLGAEVVSTKRWCGAMARGQRKPHRSVQQTISSIRTLLGPSIFASSREPRAKLPRASLLPVPKRETERCEIYFGQLVGKTESHPERFPWMIRRSRFLKPRRLEVKLRRRHGYGIGEWPAYAQQQKLLDTVLEEWHGAAVSGSGGLRPWPVSSAPCALDRRQAIDPTVPPEWSYSVETSRQPQSWWCTPVEEDAATALRGMRPSQFLTVRDPDGGTWYVLHSKYELRQSDGPDTENSLPVLVTDTYALARLEDNGRAGSPTRQGSDDRAVRVEVEAVLARTDAEDRSVADLMGPDSTPALSEQWPPQMYLAEYYRQPHSTTGPFQGVGTVSAATALYEDTFLVRLRDITKGRPTDRAIPSRALVERLGLRWSGRSLDFHVPGEEGTVVRDPSSGRLGPPALLLAAGAVNTLAVQGWKLVWRIRVTENYRFGETTWTGMCGVNGEDLADQDGIDEHIGHWRVDRRAFWRQY
ncbi:hypothetical protein [Streptomyces abikoensis]|uniref:hypothetical protein n=1 Tax=Streptomyces abikoensis TaxID=97398 RepID=UPI0016786E78|nr:hypothetical protein [Streptomyces abikoensis]GGP36731.1 hypothetical protein GCM10010214_07090 [Streptomyces abikoensis]